MRVLKSIYDVSTNGSKFDSNDELKKFKIVSESTGHEL